MKISEILKPVSRDQLKSLTRSDLVALLLGEQKIREQAEAFAKALEEEKYLIDEKYIFIKNRVFNPSSEKAPQAKPNPAPPKKNKKKAFDRTLKPSERYQNVPIIEQDVGISPLPKCKCCGAEMTDSGLTESSECLSVIPKKYIIKRQIYHKYNCRSCYGSMESTPTLPRIKSGSSYDDDFIVDVALSKYCDLIPVERYAAMAGRQGIKGLPPQSLIELTHYLADFLSDTYKLIKDEILAARILHADETPHRMLEGDERKNWFLWGFSTAHSSYFECHDTRSGSVASGILLQAEAKYLVSDVFSGYSKAVRICNTQRAEDGLEAIESSYCNAHARRKFFELPGAEDDPFIKTYQEIYRVEQEIKSLSAEERLEQRQTLIPHFMEMRTQAELMLESVSTKSKFATAAKYFLKNYEGLTRFLADPHLPIDNNHQERQLRSPVIGRKTWYGTHSRRGAETAAVLFSIVQSCKLNDVNPRSYFRQLVRDLHQKKPPYTPRQVVQEQIHLDSTW